MIDIENLLVEIDRELKVLGLPEINKEQFDSIFPYLQDPQFQQAITTGKWTPKMIAQEVKNATIGGQGITSSREEPTFQNPLLRSKTPTNMLNLRLNPREIQPQLRQRNPGTGFPMNDFLSQRTI